MSFNQQDAFNLNASREMFGSIGLHVDDPDELLTRFPIEHDSYGPKAATVLAEALMSATRFDQGMNTWIDVQCDTIPAFVEKALSSCGGFGLRVVVTHKDASSHRPGVLLPSSLRELVMRASDTRPVWHPVAKKVVEAIHFQRS